jgi:membrane peptidoglycan carboxypeptidase
VVKNSLVGNQQNLSRKLREAFLAVQLEKQIGKKKILERYLNSVYFGGGAYGVQAASSYYFGRDVKDLGWAEGALLAALVRSPTQYDPFTNPKLAFTRRHIVLGRLVTTKRITQVQADLFDLVPLPTTPNVPVPPNNYFVQQVKQQLLGDPSFNLGATPAARNTTVFSGGIKVFTTFDPDLQNKAIASRDTTLPKNRGNGTFEVRIPDSERRPGGSDTTYGTEALVSVQPDTGAVRALVGGPGYEVDKQHIDNATSLRQPGSAMKAITLAAAFEDGYVPADTINGGSCTFKFPAQPLYSPATERIGVGSLTTMTQYSSNCGFLRLSQLVGVDKVADMGHRLGITSRLADKGSNGEYTVPHSLTLGVEPVSVLDMAGAYATFANDGLHNKPYFVEKIEDRNGRVIYQHQVQPDRVVSEQVARQITEVLQNNVQQGTGTNAQIDGGQPAAGKTGTTNNSTDVWFVGYTPNLATAVWMGAPAGNISLDYAGLQGATGGRFAGTTWGRYYSAIFAGQPTQPFVAPDTTRRGKYLGNIPFEVGGRGSGSSSQRRPTNSYKPTPRSTTPGGGGGTGTG